MVKVIFREDYNPYTEEEGIMAIFPELSANAGRVQIVTFYIKQDFTGAEKVEWEPFGEGDLDIVRSRKIIHKNDERVPHLVEILEEHIEDKVEVVERITYAMDKERFKWQDPSRWEVDDDC